MLYSILLICFQKNRGEGGLKKVTSSRGGGMVKMMTEGYKKSKFGVMSFVNGPIYLNMTLSYRNNAGIVVGLYLCMISKACALYYNHINLLFWHKLD